MKHLKSFEKLSIDYKVGDYVLLDKTKLKIKASKIKYPKSSSDFTPPTEEEIENYWSYGTSYGQIYLILDRKYANYRIIFYDGRPYDVDKKDIIRHLTPDEIKMFKSMKASKKYNI